MITPLILWAASIIHIWWGVTLIVNPSTSRLLILLGVDQLSRYMPSEAVGTVLILFSIPALIGLIMERHLSRRHIIYLLFPQYTLLILTLFSDIWLIISMHHLEDSQFNRWDVGAALATIITLSALHTFGILERYYWKWSITSSHSPHS